MLNFIKSGLRIFYTKNRTVFILSALFCFVFYLSSSQVKAQVLDIELALIIAAYENDSLQVETLLEQGVSPNISTYEGVTPLMYAAQNGNKNIASTLVQYGADVNAKPDDGYTALMSACLFNHLDLAIDLIEWGADINVVNANGVSSLMIGAAYGYFYICDMLLHYGANQELKDYEGNTALLIASYFGNIDIVDLLLKKGSNINEKDKKGYNALTISIIQDFDSLSVFLLQKGILTRNNYREGLSGLDIAIAKGNTYIIKKILQAEYERNDSISVSINMKEKALLYQNKPLYKFLKSIDKQKNYRPYWSSLYLKPFGFQIGFKDFMSLHEVGLRDNRYNIDVFMGYSSRIGFKKVLIPISDSILHQYNEKRKGFYAGINKRVAFFSSFPSESGLELSLNYTFQSAYYKGMEKNIPYNHKLVPHLGFYHKRYNSIGFSLAYTYIDYQTIDLSPHRINASLLFDFGLKKRIKYSKSIRWIGSYGQLIY